MGLDDLELASRVLLDAAREVAPVVLRVVAVATDPDVVAGAVLSPVTAVRADAALAEASGPRGLSGEATALLSLGAAVSAAVASYRAAEDAVTRAVALAQDTLMFEIGAMAPELVVGVLALDALGVDVAGVLDEVVYDHPAIADLAGGTEGLVLGLRSRPLTRPLVAAPPRDEGLTREQDYEQAVRILADSAAVWGLLSDRGRARVTAEEQTRPGVVVPRSLADLAADQRSVGSGEDYPGHVRVVEVPQPSGSAWVVEISGTQVWDPRAKDNPYDVTTDVRLMAQDATVLAEGVQTALELAQADSVARSASAGALAGPEPVLLVGHSLGGIAAAGLASSPVFRQAHQVTHVVTVGSPVGRMPVPPGVEVLSLEHQQDAVPRLDGQANPDRSSWVTVSRDLDGAGADRASEAHDTRLYVETAALVDDSTDPSVTTWRAGSRQFFEAGAHGEAVIRDFRIERVVP